MADQPHLQVVGEGTPTAPPATGPTDPDAVRVRRIEPVRDSGRAASQALDVEVERWGIYGDVIDSHIDELGRPVVVVAPRRPGPAFALRGALSRRTTTHEAHAADQEGQP